MTTPSKSLAQFSLLVDAEEYFEFFGLPYDPQIVNVNRLHILRKFSQLAKAIDGGESEAKLLDGYRQALQAAYAVFVESSGVEQKLFKVFKDRPKNVVMVSDIATE
ncbi:MAG: nitrogenase-stabilizing/protective protein NifW [Cyanobacteria bacterium J06639_1]